MQDALLCRGAFCFYAKHRVAGGAEPIPETDSICYNHRRNIANLLFLPIFTEVLYEGGHDWRYKRIADRMGKTER